MAFVVIVDQGQTTKGFIALSVTAQGLLALSVDCLQEQRLKCVLDVVTKNLWLVLSDVLSA
jgi:hypothetical protein